MIANCFIEERQQWTTSETVHGVYSHHTKLQGKGNNPLYKFAYLTAFSQQKICPLNKKQNTNNHHELQKWQSAQQIALQEALFSNSTKNTGTRFGVQSQTFAFTNKHGTLQNVS